MKLKENLVGQARVKGVLVDAHLRWLDHKAPDGRKLLSDRLTGEAGERAVRGALATEWIPLAVVVEIDRGIADIIGGFADKTYAALGRHSAELNLGGVYKQFVVEEPHLFFAQMAILHRRFLDFGNEEYEQLGERSGEIRLKDYPEYSPVLCASAVGYYQGALAMMRVPGPVTVRELRCRCRGDADCAFALAW